jgi:predicted ABC-type ATPase
VTDGQPQPLVVVIAGPNGSGKSTMAPRLLQEALSVSEFVNADPIATGLSGFRPESMAMAAGRMMLARLKALAQARESFAFETTLASRTFAPWLMKLRGSGIEAIWPSCRCPALSLPWRVWPSACARGDTTCRSAIRRRFAAGLKNFFKLYRDVADTWQMFDNSRLSGPRLIASGRSGEPHRS